MKSVKRHFTGVLFKVEKLKISVSPVANGGLVGQCSINESLVLSLFDHIEM